MIELLKHIWAGPWSVKISAIFLGSIYLITLIGDPGRVIYTTLTLFAIFRLIDWVFDEK